jgi:hypothetical protein
MVDSVIFGSALHIALGAHTLSMWSTCFAPTFLFVYFVWLDRWGYVHRILVMHMLDVIFNPFTPYKKRSYEPLFCHFSCGTNYGPFALLFIWKIVNYLPTIIMENCMYICCKLQFF